MERVRASLVLLVLAASGCANVWGFKDLTDTADGSVDASEASVAPVSDAGEGGSPGNEGGCGLTNTVDNCGACGVQCAPVDSDNVAVSCDGTNCVYQCAQGRFDCPTSVPDTVGCKVANTPEHCGGCAPCDTQHSTNASCDSNGTTCSYTGCAPGYFDCDQTMPDTNGCEQQVTAASDCQICGQAGCTATHSTVTPVCEVPDGGNPYCSYPSGCAANWADCNPTPPDLHGCSTDLTTPQNCGACGRACDTVTSTGASCSSGNCAYTGCDSNFIDCDASAPNTDGCETSKLSLKACGGCGQACDTTTGTPSCDGTTCSYQCNSLRVDCNSGNAPDTDGCECTGNGCCGTDCQYAHPNSLGVPQYTFYNCDKPGTHGQADAQQACAAAGATGCTSSNLCCSLNLLTCIGSTAYSVCGTIGNTCYCWQYTGSGNDHPGTIQTTSASACSAVCYSGNSFNEPWN